MDFPLDSASDLDSISTHQRDEAISHMEMVIGDDLRSALGRFFRELPTDKLRSFIGSAQGKIDRADFVGDHYHSQWLREALSSAEFELFVRVGPEGVS